MSVATHLLKRSPTVSRSSPTASRSSPTAKEGRRRWPGSADISFRGPEEDEHLENERNMLRRIQKNCHYVKEEEFVELLDAFRHRSQQNDKKHEQSHGHTSILSARIMASEVHQVLDERMHLGFEEDETKDVLGRLRRGEIGQWTAPEKNSVQAAGHGAAFHDSNDSHELMSARGGKGAPGGASPGRNAFGGFFRPASDSRPDDSTQDWPIDFEDFVRVVETLRASAIAIPNEIANPRFPFDPESRAKQSWDLLIMILLLYTTFSVPYMLVFVNESPDLNLSPFDIFEVTLDCIFCIDVVLSFFTAYTEQGVYITDLSKIAASYLRSWFPIDFMGSVPFDKIVAAIILTNAERGGSASSNLGAIRFMRALKVVRMLKMLRAVRFMDKLNQLEQKDGFGSIKSLLRVFRSILLLVFVSHFLACAFVQMANEEAENWISNYDPSMTTASGWQRYSLGLYWAIVTLSTMGYGDVLPVTDSERLFLCFVALTGAIVFSFAMGNITSMMSQNNGVGARFDAKLAAMDEYLDFRKCRLHLKRKVKAYLGACWRKTGELYDERAVIEELPLELRNLVLQEIGMFAETQVSLLRGYPKKVIGTVFIRLSMVRFDEGDYLYKPKDPCDDMYILRSGAVECRSVQGSDPTIRDRESPGGESEIEIEVGDCFGEEALFPELCKRRMHSVKALGDIVCYSLSARAFAELKSIEPGFCDQLQAFCKLRLGARGAFAQEEGAEVGAKAKHVHGHLHYMISDLRREMEAVKTEQLMRASGTSDESTIITLYWDLEGVFLDKKREQIKWKKVCVVISPAGELLAARQDVEGLTAKDLISLGWVRRGLTEVATQAASTRRFIFGDTVCVFDVAEQQNSTREETQRVVLGAQTRQQALMLETAIADKLRTQQAGAAGVLRTTIASTLERELQRGLVSVSRQAIEHEGTLARPLTADAHTKASGAGVGSASSSSTLAEGSSSHQAAQTLDAPAKAGGVGQVVQYRDAESNGHASTGVREEGVQVCLLHEGAGAEAEGRVVGGGGGMDEEARAAVMGSAAQLQHLTAQMAGFSGMVTAVAEKLDLLEQLHAKVDKVGARMEHFSAEFERIGASVSTVSARVETVDAKVEQCLLKLNAIAAAPEPKGSEEVEQIGATVSSVRAKMDAIDGKVEECVRQLSSLSPERRDQPRTSSGRDERAAAARPGVPPLPLYAITSSSAASSGRSNRLNRKGQGGEEEEVWSQLPPWSGR